MKVCLISVLMLATACSSSSLTGLGEAKEGDVDREESSGTNEDVDEAVDEPQQIAGMFLACSVVEDEAAWTGDASALIDATLHGCAVMTKGDAIKKAEGVALASIKTEQGKDVPWIAAASPDWHALIAVPNQIMGGGKITVTFSIDGETQEETVVLGSIPSGCHKVAVTTKTVMPIVRDLDSYADSLSLSFDDGDAPVRIFDERTLGSDMRLSLAATSGLVIYEASTLLGTVKKSADCPFGFTVGFKDGADAVMAGHSVPLVDLPEGGLDVPQGASSMWIGFLDGGSYHDNEGSANLAGKTLHGSTGGCRFAFELLSCKQ